MARMTMHILSRNAARTHSMLPPLSPKSIELKVPMCCEVCEENVREELTVLEGVKEISIDVGTQKVIVWGHCDVRLEPYVVLRAVKKVKHRAEMWRK